MPADAGIYGAFAQRPVNPLDVQNALIQNQDNRLMLQQKQALVADQVRQQQEAGVLRNALMTAKPDVESRASALEATGLQSGYAAADALRKNAAAQAKTVAETAETQSKTATSNQNIGINALKAVCEQVLPAVRNPQQMATLISGLYDNPSTAPLIGSLGSKEDALKSIPQDPAQFPDYVSRFGLGMEKYVEDQTKKRGQDMTRQTSLDTTKMNNDTSRANTASNNAVQIRGQNMTDARANAAQQIGKVPTGYRANPDGTLSFIPGGPADPNVTGGKMTEDQGKATGWLVQATNAFNNMQKVTAANPNAAKPGVLDALAQVPLSGGIANSFRSADRQKFMQGASSLSESLLRAATGAGVNKDEAKQKIEELTPVFGDDDATIKQKMDAIPLYIESLRVRAGPGSAKAAAIVQPAQPSGAWKVVR